MRTKTIYGLYVEGDDMPRYIGATQNIRTRFVNHLNNIRFAAAIYRVDLSDIGLQIKAIEEVGEHKWEEREQYWIRHFTELGVQLANADPKETYYKNRKPVRQFTEEEKDEIMKAHDAGRSRIQIGRAYGCGPGLIRQVISDIKALQVQPRFW